MKLFISTCALIYCIQIQAAETGSPTTARSGSPRNSAADEVCLNNGNVFSTRDEARAKSLFQNSNLDSKEALTRLVLSEGLSTNILQKGKCVSGLPLQNIFNAIADGIRLRSIKLKQSSVLTEVFRKDQYATSFTPRTKKNGPENPFAKIFLCPRRFENYKNDLRSAKLLKPSAESLSSDDVYQMARAAADQALKKKSISDFGDIKNTTNFFYPQSPIYGHIHPKWATPANFLKGIENNCVVFYHVK